MKCKKYSYVIVLIVMLMLGIKGVYAKQELNTYMTALNNNTIIETSSIKLVNNPNYNLLQTNHVLLFGATDCDELFGDKNDPDSIRYFLNEILMYPKIIVPILVILLGVIDLAKAVMSAKEDGMRKAQATFIKRVLLGIVIFFVPTIVDLLMMLADLAWGTTGAGCNL